MEGVNESKRILFLTLLNINSIEERGIYQDLLRKFRNEGHEITIVSPVERRTKISTNLSSRDGIKFLQVRTFNIQKTNIIEKGIGTLALEYQYLNAIRKYLSNTSFDLVVYTTPPITYCKIIRYIKKRDNAFTYLLLKDIFPQNAVDMNMIKVGSLVYNYFRKIEIELYKMSDKIGCMSYANRNYVLKHNPFLIPDNIEINPNSIEIMNHEVLDDEKRSYFKEKYRIPINKKIFIYGGNIGKPQGIDFLIETLDDFKSDKRVFFVIVGAGTEFKRLQNWVKTVNPENVLILSMLPKDEFDSLIRVADFGLIFLHKDFTIPNYPSRLLSYLEFRIPILAATDDYTDIGFDITKYRCGLSVSSKDITQIRVAIEHLINLSSTALSEMQDNCFAMLKNEFSIDQSYEKIIRHL